MDRKITWSYGGGTQSIAIAVLIAQGQLPKPEMIAIADTGREASETWEYTAQHVAPLLAPLGLEIEIVPHDLATVDLYSHKGELLIPAWDSPDSQLDTFCSVEWKQRVFRRYARAKGYGPDDPIVTWIGMSRDEIGRLKPSDVKWQEYRYPLAMDLRMSRHDCVELITNAGLPTPPKSSCWMCPFRKNSQWKRLKEHYPLDFQKAIELDEEVYQSHKVRVHRSAVALADVDLSAPDEKPLPLFGEVNGCDSGFCWT